MSKEKAKKLKAIVGTSMPGRLPDPIDCPCLVVDQPALCTPEQWAALGHPLTVVRYGLSYGGECYGYSYAWTWVKPCERIALRVQGPSNLLTIDVGIVTTGGETWAPATCWMEGDPAAAADLVRRRLGRQQSVIYWDHSLSAETAARYLTADGNVSVLPVMDDPGTQPDDPGRVLAPDLTDIARLEGEGGIVIDPVPEAEGE